MAVDDERNLEKAKVLSILVATRHATSATVGSQELLDRLLKSGLIVDKTKAEEVLNQYLNDLQGEVRATEDRNKKELPR